MARRPRADPAVTLAGRSPRTSIVNADPGPLVRPTTSVPADRDPLDPATTAVQAGPDPLVRPTTTVPADPVGPPRGMGIHTAATSTAPHGETDPHPGVRVSRRGRPGADRSRRRAGDGWAAQSTTGATRKRPCGMPDSTNGGSGCSGSGSRCNPAVIPLYKRDHTTLPCGAQRSAPQGNVIDQRIEPEGWQCRRFDCFWRPTKRVFCNPLCHFCFSGHDAAILVNAPA
jgi:hypothetical protein